MAEIERTTAGRITEAGVRRFLDGAGVNAARFETGHPRAWERALRNRQALSVVPRILHAEGSVERLSRLSVPTLVTRGTRSMDFDVAMSDELVRIVPDSLLLELPGAHGAHIDNAEAFVRVFLRLVEGAGMGTACDSGP